MPELPEVQTTVNGLKKHILGLKIADVWSDYDSSYFKGSETIKDPSYFRHFRKEVRNKKVVSVERRAKNILINLDSDSTILVHMKMTGHLMYGLYKFNAKAPKDASGNKKDPWEPVSPPSLKDPFNRRVHFLISFSNKKHLALSDMRKFAKVTLINTGLAHESTHLNDIGPEPLEKGFTFEKFKGRLNLRPNGKVKQILMDQAIIAGIGNIYAVESLWRAGIHPLERVKDISDKKLRELFDAVRKTLLRGIDFGGDSMSDYRNVLGEKGKFQEEHNVYRKTGEKCPKPGCGGTIRRIVVGGRGTNFCDKHQSLSVKR